MKKLKTQKAIYRATYYDYLLAIIIVVLSVAPLFAFVKSATNPLKAEIYVNNKLLEQINLSIDGTTNIGNMQIEVKDKKVRVLKSDCPNQICIHAGWISQPGQSLICLPNKVVVNIPIDHKNGKYDVISY
ncbi:MAG: NusG domain II-containing protein [bacterium]